MNGTFEKRLKKAPLRNRLGNSNNGISIRNDLRDKLNATVRSRDARTLLRTRMRQRNMSFRDARSMIQMKNLSFRRRNTRVPFFIPTRTIRNEFYSKPPVTQRNIGGGRRQQNVAMRSEIPDLLSLPIPIPTSLNFLQGSAPPTGLFANLVPFAGLQNPLTNTSGSKLSPIQGFRVEVRNLQSSVTLDDVFELFSSVGSLRLCTITRPGQAEVIFNHASDAVEAVERYNGRELDGRPMRVSLVTPVADLPVELDTAGRMASRLGPNYGRKEAESHAKQVIRDSQNRSGAHIEIDPDVVRKALFNVSSGKNTQIRRPVDFNVSLR